MVLCHGGQAAVLKAIKKDDGKLVVIKVMDKQHSQQVKTENEAYRKLAIKGGVSFSYFLAEHIDVPLHSIEDFLMMKYYPLSMSDWIKVKGVPLLVKRLQLNMIFRAVAYCHNKNIAHCDIKPANIMIDEHLVPKLIDFGMAHIKNSALAYKPGGTKSYQAPELLVLTRMLSNEELLRGDCWSLGVLAHVVLYMQHPFGTDIIDQVSGALKPILFGSAHGNDIAEFTNLGPETDGARDLITKLLKVKPEERLTAAQALRHPFLEIKYPYLDLPNVVKLAVEL